MSPNNTSYTDPLHLKVDHRGDAIVAKLSGSAHMEDTSELQDKLVALVDEHPKQLIIDLTDLNFISSVGLGGIIAAHLRSRHNKGVVKLVSPQSTIMDLLEVTRLTKLFDIYDSVDSALAD